MSYQTAIQLFAVLFMSLPFMGMFMANVVIRITTKGGVMLAQMSSTEGCTGISAPLGSCHRPKRELYDQMQAFINGINAAKAVQS